MARPLSSFTPEPDTTYYIDVSVANPIVGARRDLIDSTVTWSWEGDNGSGGTETKTEVVTNAGQLHWPDDDGMFPSGNRGWAYAGYNADHADANEGGSLVESQFAFSAESSGYDDETDVPPDGVPSAGEVTGGVDTSFEPAFPYIPWAGSGSSVADRWRAAEKETLNGTSQRPCRPTASAPTHRIAGLTLTVGRQAPQMLSVDGDFNFMLGLVCHRSPLRPAADAPLKGYRGLQRRRLPRHPERLRNRVHRPPWRLGSHD